MELTDNDRQRIAMAGRNCEYPISFWEGAEYATIYERERQIKTLSRPGSKYYVSYDPDYKDKVFGVFNKEDLTQQGAEKMAQQLNNLEAERSELRNKVIEECIAVIKPMKNGFNYNQIDADDAIQFLNSLKK